jgi:hypothetical protein
VQQQPQQAVKMQEQVMLGVQILELGLRVLGLGCCRLGLQQAVKGWVHELVLA